MKNLGKLGRDKVTGFEGIIIGKVTYLYGCNQYGLAPKSNNGKVEDSSWFDEGRIEIVGDGVKPAEVQSDKNGGESSSTPNNIIR